MYIVASTWEVIGDQADAMSRGQRMRQLLRGQAGIEFIHHFPTTGNEIMVIVGYTDEATYKKLIDDPHGPFVTNMEALKLEDVMQWKHSWRGTAVPE